MSRSCNLNIKHVLPLLITMFWSAPLPAPVIIGNGGDVIRLVYADAVTQAASLLRELPAKPANDDSLAAAWLWENNLDLLSSLTSAAHIWGDKLPFSCPVQSCACVLQHLPNSVFFSTASCKESTKTIEDAGKLLIHEAVHQQGILDEAFADKVALIAYNAWRVDTKKVGSWSWLPPSETHPTHSAAVAAGSSSIFVWGGQGQHQQNASGLHLDINAKMWKVLTNDHLGGRNNALAAWTGERFIVYGGERDESGTTKILNDGAFYDPKTNQWEQLSLVNAPRPHADAVKIMTPHGLFVWSEADYAYPTTDHMTAGMLDFRENRWRRTSEVYAGSIRPQTTAVWSGKEIIIFAKWGYRRRVLDLTGVAYNPVEDRWRIIAPPSGHEDYRSFDRIETVFARGQIYYFGIDFLGQLTLIGRYDPEADIWLPPPNRNHPPSFTLTHRLFAFNDNIIALGDLKTGEAMFLETSTGLWKDIAKNHHLEDHLRLTKFAALPTSDGILIWGGQRVEPTTGLPNPVETDYIWKP